MLVNIRFGTYANALLEDINKSFEFIGRIFKGSPPLDGAFKSAGVELGINVSYKAR